MSVMGFLSGEFALKRRANGGGVVLFRALFVTVFLYLLAFVFKTVTDKGAVLSFSFAELKADVNNTIPWFGAIFAGAYAAFYARYSNQWAYLAATYNQIMQVKCGLDSDKQSNNHSLINWQAGFISDAFTLHLDRKEIFSGVVAAMMDTPQVATVVKSNLTHKEWMQLCERHDLDECSGNLIATSASSPVSSAPAQASTASVQAQPSEVESTASQP